jgi:hypothetical protein
MSVFSVLIVQVGVIVIFQS